MTDRELMQQALDALEQSHTRAPFGADGVVYWEGVKIHEAAVTALRDRLAQPEQEPFSPEAISATQAAWKMGYDAAKAEQPEQKPVAWESFFKRYCPWLAQPEPEPVAIALNTGTKQGVKWLKNVEHGERLYTAPPQRKPLKLREIEKCIYDANNDPIVACRNVEAAPGIKENT